MAEKVDGYEFRPRLTEGTGKYPWNEWLDGSVWRLKSGEDFEVSAIRFRSQAIAAARKRGLRLDREVQGDTLIVRAIRE